MVAYRSIGPRQKLALAGTPFAAALEKRVLECVRVRGVLVPGERVLAAVSGGPDSTALLVLLARLRPELGLDITVAHFNHMLREREDAAGDAAFVRDMAISLGLPFVAGADDVPARARRARRSVEDAARRARYAFLAREAKRAGAAAVALGHTRDDQAETVLLHLLRGSGLDGLVAMRSRSGWPFARGPAVARPLLQVSRRETERYCRDRGLTPRDDPTNELLIATRNRVRHELLPVLRSFNPRIEEALARLAEAAARDVDFLEAEAGELWLRLAGLERARVSFDRDALAAAQPALLARLLRRAFARVAGSAADLEAVHIEALLASLAKRRDRVSLPRGVSAVVGAGRLTFLRGTSQRRPGIAETLLTAPGITRAGAWSIRAEAGPAPANPVRAAALEAVLDAERIAGRLTVRSRRPGDRLRPLGLGGEKKVQDILVDAKVPAEERDGVPIVSDEAGIVWVVGHCIAGRVGLGPGSRRALRLEASPGKRPRGS
ncbi:MAG: tRNA lysidine(34) synthetase TilS [Dehalococcoidia bacterium]|nr:tRNA lysidine(34) synthetase TilS [Dehalococcoidia bacterium]